MAKSFKRNARVKISPTVIRKMKGARPIKEEEIPVLLRELAIRERVLCLSGFHFGARISEALQLRFQDVDGSEVLIKALKGSNDQSYPIAPVYRGFVQALKKAYEEQGRRIDGKSFLFLSRQGREQRLSRQQASLKIQKAVQASRLEGKVSFHSFRKYFINYIFKETGFNLAETRSYSRHASLSSLQAYIETSGNTNLVLGYMDSIAQILGESGEKAGYK